MAVTSRTGGRRRRIRPPARTEVPDGPVVVVSGLHRSRDGATVLDGVDLTVAEHQVVTLIGASGSGKSTLLRCVDLLEEIDDGRILLDGDDISDPRRGPKAAAAAQRRMAIVFQAFNLFPHMTAGPAPRSAARSCAGTG